MNTKKLISVLKSWLSDEMVRAEKEGEPEYEDAYAKVLDKIAELEGSPE